MHHMRDRTAVRHIENKEQSDRSKSLLPEVAGTLTMPSAGDVKSNSSSHSVEANHAATLATSSKIKQILPLGSSNHALCHFPKGVGILCPHKN